MSTRERWRRRLLLAGLLPLLAAVLFAAKVGLMLTHDHDGRSSYAAADWSDARGSFAGNATLNVLEPWVASYDEGTARYREDDGPGAVTALERALTDVPPEEECRVRINLALAHETVGDAARAADDPGAARAAYQQGLDVLAEGGCTAPEADPAPQREDALAVDGRLRERRSSVVDELAAQRDAAEAERQARLDERNQEGRDERDETEERQQDNEDERDDPPPPAPTDGSQPPPTYEW